MAQQQSTVSNTKQTDDEYSAAESNNVVSTINNNATDAEQRLNALETQDIVALINTALGQNFWQQGISNAVFVNDWSEDSPELAPYLATSGPNAGKWEVGTASPLGTNLIVVNTDRLSLEGIMEREIARLVSFRL